MVKLFKYLIIRKDNGIGKLKNSGGQGYALWDRGGSFLKIISRCNYNTRPEKLIF